MADFMHHNNVLLFDELEARSLAYNLGLVLSHLEDEVHRREPIDIGTEDALLQNAVQQVMELHDAISRKLSVSEQRDGEREERRRAGLIKPHQTLGSYRDQMKAAGRGHLLGDKD